MEGDSLPFLFEPQLEESPWDSHDQRVIPHSYPPATCWAANARAWAAASAGAAQGAALAGQATPITPASIAQPAGAPQSEMQIMPAGNLQLLLNQPSCEHPPPIWQQVSGPPAQQQQQQRADTSNAGGSRGKAERKRSTGQPGGMSRQQLRLLQRQQRATDQSRIKGLEQQLGALRRQLEVRRHGWCIGWTMPGLNPELRMKSCASTCLPV